MSVGHAGIDSDHRYLLTLINLVELCLRYNDAFFDIALEQLVKYTHEHFKREEMIQIKMKYNGYAAHKLAHQELLSTLTVITESLKELKNTTKVEVSGATKVAGMPTVNKQTKDIDELMILIRHWIIDHVLGVDMKMKPMLERIPVNYM